MHHQCQSARGQDVRDTAMQIERADINPQHPARTSDWPDGPASHTPPEGAASCPASSSPRATWSPTRTCGSPPTAPRSPRPPWPSPTGSKDPDGAWIDGHTSYYEQTVWGTPADNFADTARKGARLVAAGELIVEEYTDSGGQTRTTTRITATHLGLSTRFAPRTQTQPTREALTAAQ